MIQFKIPFLPPSVNKAYGWDPVRKSPYLRKEAKMFKDQCKLFIPAVNNLTDQLIKIDLEFWGNWYYKNGRVKKHDGQNLTKILFDAIFEKLGIDDCYIWEWSGQKVQSTETATVVTITAIGLSNEKTLDTYTTLEKIKLRYANQRGTRRRNKRDLRYD